MPMTFPTHPIAVVPLKLWRPRWFDGVALVLGSMSPDIAYVADGSGLPVWPLSHQLHGLFLFCLPVTLFGCYLVRRAAPVVAAHLPAGGPFALRDYGALHVSGHRWWITVTSAVLGPASHLLLDGAEALFPAIEYPAHAVGAIIMLTFVLLIGKRRLVRHWHGAAPRLVPHPARFWLVAAVAALPGLAVTPFLPAAFLLHTTGARVLTALAVGLLVAAAAAVSERRLPTSQPGL
jgi:hypothetical protein